jgi:hypothetical protein
MCSEVAPGGSGTQCVISGVRHEWHVAEDGHGGWVHWHTPPPEPLTNGEIVEVIHHARGAQRLPLGLVHD